MRAKDSFGRGVAHEPTAALDAELCLLNDELRADWGQHLWPGNGRASHTGESGSSGAPDTDQRGSHSAGRSLVLCEQRLAELVAAVGFSAADDVARADSGDNLL